MDFVAQAIFNYKNTIKYDNSFFPITVKSLMKAFLIYISTLFFYEIWIA